MHYIQQTLSDCENRWAGFKFSLENLLGGNLNESEKTLPKKKKKLMQVIADISQGISHPVAIMCLTFTSLFV